MPARVSLLSNQGPQLVQSGVMVPRTAQLVAGDEGAMGQALQNVSQNLASMAEKMAKANDARQMIEAEGAMRQALQDQLTFQQQEPDQEKWLPAWQAKQADLEGKFSKLKLTDGARLALTQSFGRFSSSQGMQIQEQAFAQSQRRAMDAVTLRVEQAKRDRDPQAVADTMRFAATSGVLTPERGAIMEDAARSEIAQLKRGDYQNRLREIELASDVEESQKGEMMMQAADQAFADGLISKAERDLQYQAGVETKKWGDFMAAARTDPDMAQIRLEDGEFGTFNEQTKRKAVRAAEAILTDYQDRELVDFANHTALGGRPELFTWRWMEKTPARLADVKAKMAERPLTTQEVAATRLGLEGAIESYDLNTDKTRQELINITSTLERMPAPMVTDLRTKLQKRLTAEPPGPNEQAIGVFKKMLGEMTQAETAPFFDKQGVLDLSKKAAYEQKLLEQNLKLKRFTDIIGPEPTYEKFREASRAVLGGSATENVMRYFQGLDLGLMPQSQPATFPPNNPDNPEQRNNVLLGPPPPGF